MGDGDYNWSNLLSELVVVIAHRLPCIEDYIRFTSVCKSWKSATDEAQNPWLPPCHPMLLLAEDVSPAAIIINHDFDDNDEYCDCDRCYPHYTDDDDDDDDNENDDNEDEADISEEETDTDDWPVNIYDHQNSSVGITRGLYSLSTAKTYNIQLPEAAGRLILGTNKGWLLTLGRDLQINLLHPLFRHQVPLPPMLTLPIQYPYSKEFPAEEYSDKFIEKVAMSSRIPTNNSDNSSAAIIMVIYGECGYLSFARLGDKVWTEVNVPSRSFHDVIYHKGKFCAVDCHGNVFVCAIDEKGEARGTKIASFETYDWDQKYLVESSSGSGLLIVVRTYMQKVLKPPRHQLSKYRTTNFSVWRLELEYSDCLETPPSSLIEEKKNLGNQALFVGRASSVCVSSSETIKPNCIYFTDDKWETYYRAGGGHDMGIYNMESGTIEPHFQGKSVHPFSPPLWYI